LPIKENFPPFSFKYQYATEPSQSFARRGIEYTSLCILLQDSEKSLAWNYYFPVVACKKIYLRNLPCTVPLDFLCKMTWLIVHYQRTSCVLLNVLHVFHVLLEFSILLQNLFLYTIIVVRMQTSVCYIYIGICNISPPSNWLCKISKHPSFI
jgi:hypothetical protein